MINLKGTKTEANLRTAFSGESQARTNYEHFAAKAREEGLGEVAHYFATTAVNEQEHANIWMRFLEECKPVEANTKTPTVGTSKENLQVAISGETYENTEMYPKFSQIAKEEGFEFLAKLFQQVSDIEKTHADYYKVLLTSSAPACPLKSNRTSGNAKSAVTLSAPKPRRPFARSAG